MSALVSVIIPTFNRAPLLDQAINSVINQTVGDVEIVIVDDGSSDGTCDMVKRFGDRVRFFRQEHGGLNVARNLGLSKAQGKYIALLDDDDLWLPYKTELQLALMDRFSGAAYVFSDYIIFNEGGVKATRGLSIWNSFPASWKHGLEQRLSATALGLILPPEVPDCHVYLGSLYLELLFDPYVLPSTALVRRSAIKVDTPFPEGNTHCGDWQFFAELSRNSPCVFLAMATTMNRSHGDAVRLTRKSPRVQGCDRLKLIDEVWKSDPAFMEIHKADVYQVEAQQLLKMSKYCLLDGEHQESKLYLRKWRALPIPKGGILPWLLHVFSWLPGSVRFLKLALLLKRRILSTPH